MLFSLVYPTRHRPEFVQKALWFLERQQYHDFEVIVSDNYSDPALSCERICRASTLPRLKYVRPSTPLSMVAHWNFALQFATGEYICYFTDKMFLLPGTLTRAAKCIDQLHPEIVNWVDDSYQAKRFPDYFGEGDYYRATPRLQAGLDFASFDPQGELSVKARADVPRTEQDKSTYTRGKICFGAYHKSLVRTITDRTGALFHRVTPDYTSMILGLSFARSAAELGTPGIVHVQTDLSTGGQVGARDEAALGYLSTLGELDAILKGMLVPGLYSSPHNLVTHDYLVLKRRFNLDFEFDAAHWLVHITEDLTVAGRIWSSPQVEAEQQALLNEALSNLREAERRVYERKLHERACMRDRAGRSVRKHAVLRSLVPTSIKSLARRFLPRRPFEGERYARIEEVLSDPRGTVPLRRS